jgi:opacity protein-like surface antigen
MNPRLSTFAGVVLAAGLASPASACDLCALFSALETQQTQPGWYVGLAEQYSSFETLLQDGEEVDNEADQSLTSSITQVVVGYQLNRRFGLQVNAPWIDRSFDRIHDGEAESGSETGLGDVTLLAHYRAYEWYENDRAFVFNLLGGVKLPTGDSDRLAEEAEEGHHEEDAATGLVSAPLGHEGEEHGEEIPAGVHGHDLALGSGSTDALLGFSGFGSRGRFFTGFELQYWLRQEGDLDYRFGDDLSWSIAPGYFLWLGHDRSLALALELFGENKDKDELAGEELGDTGLDAIYLGPSLRYSETGRFSSQLTVDLPLEQDTTDLQIVPDYRVRLGGIWRF